MDLLTLLGGGAALGVVIGFWNQIKGFFVQFISRIVVSCEVHEQAVRSVIAYLMKECKISRYGKRVYSGIYSYVRPVSMTQIVGYESVGQSVRLFWKGWKPIWVSRSTKAENKDVNFSFALFRSPITVTFMRGTFNPDNLIRNAIDYYNRVVVEPDQSKIRYRIIHVTGSAGKSMVRSSAEPLNSVNEAPSEGDGLETLLTNRLLRWSQDDLGPENEFGKRPMDRLALSSSAIDIVDEIKYWIKNKKWYRERGVPWKRGYLLYGEPGTGKTAFVRAIGQELNLPIYNFDLVTLFNDEMRKKWNNMLSVAPCIALIEDIDAVYDKRNAKQGELSFNCLLNCIDGVEEANGILTFVTTNNADTLDEALGGVCPENGKMMPRPGRIDRAVRMTCPDEGGRKKIARRILLDWPEEWIGVVEDGEGETGAQFQDRCIRHALEMHWQNRSVVRARITK